MHRYMGTKIYAFYPWNKKRVNKRIKICYSDVIQLSRYSEVFFKSLQSYAQLGHRVAYHFVCYFLIFYNDILLGLFLNFDNCVANIFTNFQISLMMELYIPNASTEIILEMFY